MLLAMCRYTSGRFFVEMVGTTLTSRPPPNGIHLRKTVIHLTNRLLRLAINYLNGRQAPKDTCAAVGLAGLGGFHLPIGFLERRS